MPVSTVFEKSMEMSNRHEHLDRSWLAALLGRGAWAELGARITALVAPGSDLQETGLRLAGAAARVEVVS